MTIKQRLIQNSILSIIMSAIMSLVMLALNGGIQSITLFLFFRGFIIGFLITMPIGYFLTPVIEKIITKNKIEKDE